jgi:hypothetical protein
MPRITVLLCPFAVLLAQTAPTAYTVTQTNAMMGAPVTMTIMRDGSKAVIEQNDTRQWIDIDSHRNWSISLKDPSAGCSVGRWSGDWGDPFSFTDEAAKQGLKETGTETINGVATKVSEGGAAPNVIKAWLDPKTGLLMRADVAGHTIIETKSFKAGKPAGPMTPPASCTSQTLPPSNEERIAAETGDAAANYSNAAMAAAGSGDSCSVLFRVAQAGSLQPVAKFQVAIDTTSQPGSGPHYSYGISADGHYTFSGGGLHEVTAQVRNGVLRIDNAPPYFYLDVAFGQAGESSAGIYRQCAGPVTTLLLVVKNTEKASDGADFLWVKSGKNAGR